MFDEEPCRLVLPPSPDRPCAVAHCADRLVRSQPHSRTNFDTKFQLPDTDSAAVLALLQKDFPAASGSSDQIVLHVSTGTVRDAEVQRSVEQMLASVATVPHVEAVASPYAASGAAQISKDGKTAFATVSFDEQSQALPKDDVKRVMTIAQAAGSARVQVALGGQDIEQAQSAGTSSSTGIGILLALIVLGLAFGALFAAFLPLITALVAIGVGYSLTGLLSQVMSIASFATILGVLIGLGLGVGVDYALLIVTRHRSGLTAGHDIEAAAVKAVNTAGRAVFFAGLTVCVALLGQFTLGVSFLYGIAIAAALTVALTVLASLTLLPALLGFFGDRVFSRRQRARVRNQAPAAEEATGRWARWAALIARRPTLPGIAAFALVVLVGLPIFSLHLGLDDAGSDATSTTTHQAYEFITEGFGPGFSGPSSWSRSCRHGQTSRSSPP
jgi:RND superfamily putative drug exporter